MSLGQKTAFHILRPQYIK